MKREDDEKLWDLLGRAPSRDVSPFFARNILRRVRAEPRWLVSARNWFSLKRLVPVAALTVAILAAVFVGQNPTLRRPMTVSEADPVARIDPQDYEVVADLDELLASSDDNSLWDENSSL